MFFNRTFYHCIVFLAGLYLPVISQAEEITFCVFGQQERLIRIVYPEKGAKLPCEVLYTKDGNTDQTEVLWRAETQEGYCEQKFDQFKKQQEEWGWRCSVVTDKQTNPYLQQTAIVQALTTTTGFKVRMSEYYVDEGHFPSTLGDIGLSPDSMRNSTWFSDLKLADGTILIKGNDKSGLDTVIRLTPRVTLGGMNMEWACHINIQLEALYFCDYEADLVY